MNLLKNMTPKPEIHLYNSLGRTLQRLESKIPRHITLYTCGPTIYDYVHIGNLRTFIFEDILRRSLKLFGYQVNQVMNLTDVDDKTIRGAIREGVALRKYTERYEQAFFEDIEALRIEKVEHYPRATDYIPAMIEMIQKLMVDGYAYQGSDHSVYFSIERYREYGRLSQLPSCCEKLGHARINHDEYDKDVMGDFVLWKAHDPERDGSIFWTSPFGNGRPGWHIECSAMAKAILGEQIDVHTGGIDNLFPHHENEIAQSECCHHKPFARYWMHAEHLLVDGKKMSKSSGNFYTLRDLLKQGIDPMAVRYLLLQSHYRHSMNFTFEGVRAAARSLERLRDFYFRIKTAHVLPGRTDEVCIATEMAAQKFMVALAGDLNTSAALAAIFEWTSQMHKWLDEGVVKVADLKIALQFLMEIDRVLDVLEPSTADRMDLEVKKWFEERLQARAQKQWALSDELRMKIEQAGYIIEDSPQGSRLKKRVD